LKYLEELLGFGSIGFDSGDCNGLGVGTGSLVHIVFSLLFLIDFSMLLAVNLFSYILLFLFLQKKIYLYVYIEIAT
jgi:hypothetical protein